jgi:GGDEF domain-containing protein
MEQCCEQNEFMGHIGGDDFVIICDYWEAKELCQKIIDMFERLICGLYTKPDWDNGYILSKNRNGFTEKFPIVSLSIAGITNQKKNYTNLDHFSQEIALVKKKCKQVEGNYICFL